MSYSGALSFSCLMFRLPLPVRHNARRDSLHVKVVCLGNDTCIWKGVREAMSVNYLAGACAEVEEEP